MSDVKFVQRKKNNSIVQLTSSPRAVTLSWHPLTEVSGRNILREMSGGLFWGKFTRMCNVEETPAREKMSDSPCRITSLPTRSSYDFVPPWLTHRQTDRQPLIGCAISSSSCVKNRAKHDSQHAYFSSHRDAGQTGARA